MRKLVVIRNGKKYLVNTPDWGDSGDESGVGSPAPVGILWMRSITDGLWYEITLNGTSGSFVNSSSLSVNQTPLTWTSNDLGYQLLLCPDNNQVYQTYLSGSAGSVSMSISQTPWPISSDYKPYLWMQSTADRYFYPVYARSGSVYLWTDQNGRVWMNGGTPPVAPPVVYDFRITEIGDIRITEIGDFRII